MAPTGSTSAQLLTQIRAREESQLAVYCVSPFEVIKNIIVFFALNVFAHALTILQMPGQKLSQTIVMAFFMVVSPVFARSAYSHAFGKMFSAWWRRFREFRLAHLTFKERLRVILRGEGEGEWGLQAAIDASAVAIPLHPVYNQEMQEWKQLNLKSIVHKRDALYVDGMSVNENEDIRYVPVGTITSSPLNVKPSSSLLQTIIAIGQLCYASFELYSSERPQVSARGLSSPYIIIIPYVVMSLVNLFINLCVGTYPYVTVLRPIAMPQSSDKVESYVTVDLAPSNGDDESSSEARLLTSEGEPSEKPRPPFREWLLDQYGLELRNLEPPSYHGEWLAWSLPINLLVCYGVITLLLVLVTRLQVNDLFLAVSFLCWIYSGIVQYIFILLLAGINFLSRSYFSNGFGTRTSVTIFICTVFVLAAVGPLCPGAYGAVRELWKYYSACTPDLRIVKPAA